MRIDAKIRFATLLFNSLISNEKIKVALVALWAIAEACKNRAIGESLALVSRRTFG